MPTLYPYRNLLRGILVGIWIGAGVVMLAQHLAASVEIARLGARP